MPQEITRRARALRSNMTESERVLWQVLRARQIRGYKFRRQFPIGNYIVDFICLEAKLIIEVDGGQHAEAISYDVSRDKWLSSQGFKVLRFWNTEVLQELDGVRQAIFDSLPSS